MCPPSTWIRLETDLIATKSGTLTVDGFLQVMALRLIQRKKAIPPGKAVLGPLKFFRSHPRGDHATTRRLPGLQPLGQGPIDNALAIASRLAIGNTKGVHHL